jgi:hypothetical protein
LHSRNSGAYGRRKKRDKPFRGSKGKSGKPAAAVKSLASKWAMKDVVKKRRQLKGVNKEWSEGKVKEESAPFQSQ